MLLVLTKVLFAVIFIVSSVQADNQHSALVESKVNEVSLKSISGAVTASKIVTNSDVISKKRDQKNIDAKLSTALISIDHKPLAPRFSLPDMHEVPRKLSDYLGKPVIVSFWATWCPPCRKEIPYFNRAWEKLKGSGVEMLFININEGKDTIEAYTKEHPIKLTILRDEGAGQLQNWNMTGLPTTFIIDAEGRVVYQAMGEREWDSDLILNKVKALRR